MMSLLLSILLLILTLALSVYDFRTRRVPNVVTLPLLLVGMIWHAPGTMEVWTGTALLFGFWQFETLGAGDAKLWMALLWLTPPEYSQAAFLILFGSFFLTALAQLFWRKVRGRPATGYKTPGVWRALPFALWLVTVSSVR